MEPTECHRRYINNTAYLPRPVAFHALPGPPLLFKWKHGSLSSCAVILMSGIYFELSDIANLATNGFGRMMEVGPRGNCTKESLMCKVSAFIVLKCDFLLMCSVPPVFYVYSFFSVIKNVGIIFSERQCFSFKYLHLW